MKKLMICILAATTSISAFSNEVFFTKDRRDKLACTIAKSIKHTYPNKTLHEFRKDILDILRVDINPWVDAYPIPAGLAFPAPIQKITGLSGFPMSRSEYYMQNAFILFGNPKMELKESSENYFSSFIHLARSRQVAYLNGETKKFKLRNEPDIIQQIEDHLPVVANYTFPYQDENGQPIMQHKAGVKEKNLEKLAIGNPNHKMFNEFVYESQRYNHFSSPLFMWLLKQDDFSITPEKLFDKALDIYGDPIVALGVIPWIFSGDALTVNRGTSSIVSYKVEKLVEGDDVPGLQYHFWGYLTQGLIGNKARVDALSYIYEDLYQHDAQDRDTDVLSLTFSSEIRNAFNHIDDCK